MSTDLFVTPSESRYGRRPDAPPSNLTIDDFLEGACGLFTHIPDIRVGVNSRGARFAWLQCRACQASTTYIKHAVFAARLNVDVKSLPINENDNRCVACGGAGCSRCCRVPCARCRQYKPTHGHHTAPRALFEDADLWPIVDLCAECHSYWHSIMTPGVRWNPSPVPKHLRSEWDDYRLARDKLVALGHPNEYGPDYSGPCRCLMCAVWIDIIDCWHERYGWATAA